MPKACEAPASLGPGRGEAGALVDLLRVQQAGRATTTILALRSGESRVLPPRGSILPTYRFLPICGARAEGTGGWSGTLERYAGVTLGRAPRLTR